MDPGVRRAFAGTAVQVLVRPCQKGALHLVSGPFERPLLRALSKRMQL